MTRWTLVLLVACLWAGTARAEGLPGSYYGGVSLDFSLDPGLDGSYQAELLLDGRRRLTLERGASGWELTVERPGGAGIAGSLNGSDAPAWGHAEVLHLRRWNGRLLGKRYDLQDPDAGPPQLKAWERATFAHREAFLRSERYLPAVLTSLEDAPHTLKPFVQRFGGPEAAVRLIEVLAREDTRERRLAVHWVFDASRQRGYLDRVLTQLRERQPNACLRELLAQAQPTRRPRVIAHRGNPIDFPENTLPAIRSAVELGADALEVDLCLTRDRRLAVWHDHSPGDLVTLARNLGLEGGVGYQPVLPGLLSSYRRPTHELTLAELRAHYGYTERRFSPLGFTPDAAYPILDFDALAAYLERTPQLGLVLLDLKLPPDAPRVHRAFARVLRRLLRRHRLGERVVLMNNDPDTTATLKRVLGDAFRVTRDVELPGGGDSAVAAALELGNPVASVGRPRLFASYGAYLEILRADRARIDAEGLEIELITWTLNDELELREVLAIGVDGIVTDRPAQLVALLEAYRF